MCVYVHVYAFYLEYLFITVYLLILRLTTVLSICMLYRLYFIGHVLDSLLQYTKNKVFPASQAVCFEILKDTNTNN